jgi:uncharacterized membrane protein YedE/YeeE
VKLLIVLLGGTLFGFGLALSTMTKQESVLAFLRFDDFGLLLVMAGGMAVTALAFALARITRRGPLLAPAYDALRDTLDARTVAGAAIFGVGWGISGLCPGSAIASVGTGNWPVLLGLAGMLLGAYAQGRFAAERRAPAPTSEVQPGAGGFRWARRSRRPTSSRG